MCAAADCRLPALGVLGPADNGSVPLMDLVTRWLAAGALTLTCVGGLLMSRRWSDEHPPRRHRYQTGRRRGFNAEDVKNVYGPASARKRQRGKSQSEERFPAFVSLLTVYLRHQRKEKCLYAELKTELKASWDI